MTRIIVLALVLFFSISCNSKKNSLATECFYQAYEDGGKQMKKAIAGYESLLIQEGIIKSDDGSSYIALFNTMAEKNSLIYKPSISFTEYLKPATDNPQNNAGINCQDIITIMEKFEKSTYYTEKQENWSVSSFANGILTSFNEKDFESDLCKVSFFYMFDTINFENTNSLMRNLEEQ